MNHSRVVDVKAWIDARPISRFQWNVLLLCFVIIMLDGYDAAVMGFIAPALIEDWGISRAQMGPVLGAAMFGVAIGALVAGPLSDRYGRKRILLWSVALFALFSLAGALAQSPSQLALMRFLTGLGLGAVMPNCVTLVAEYMPERRKGLMITLMYSGFNVGSGLGGFIAAGLLSHYSWHSALIFGGVLPLVVLPFMIVMLPESAMNMVARRLPSGQIAGVLNRLGGSFSSETRFQLNAPQISRHNKVVQLFRNGYARGTVALWLTYFMGLFVIYLLNGWLPTILRSGGLSLQQAAIITGLFQLGGPLGGILVGYLMDRTSAKAVIAVTYFLGCVCLLTQGLMDFGSAALSVLIFISGMCINGAQNGLQAYSPAYYQTEIRATGVSWMHGIGRTGAILSSTLGGVIMLAVPGHSSIFLVLALPACLAGAAILLHRMNHPKPRQTEADLSALSGTVHNR
ncbi:MULTISPECIES: aromatic acid/H+ symport family MFS transporter [Enterobacteriaceae]|uniref:Aromatic acid/H+ symport family MFS transporter n=1 Tax=Raoultella lignicola TaxID=3040939 RepID=A0ABU9F8F1_9ENTR|nr:MULTISPECIES: aromatic acid/H+ symport family MFS transporter [Enterobacteriaceae]MRT50149.1 MFS transporter [Raoultella sp. RIT712]QNK06793.1 aromatic acid/H+ symport family MFS transporter [Enterobacter sp. JUb54]ROS09878.1 benzoate transport [Raoultella sp. BIGb0399]